MVQNSTAMRGEHSARLRIECGAWLADLRRRAGLTQQQLADLVGVKYFTTVSQIELGRGFPPADKWLDYALAFEVEPAEFAREMLRYTNPWAHALLFGSLRAYRKISENVPFIGNKAPKG